LADILFFSLNIYAQREMFNKFFVVCPSDQMDILSAYIRKWPEMKLILVDEEQLVPEFRKYPDVTGWRKQQIIKLAISSLMESRFYLTFDADVVCTSPLSEEILLPDNRALLQLQDIDIHRNWWISSARYIDINLADITQGMDVTPAILATDVCRSLMGYLTKDKKSWVEILLAPHRQHAWQKFLPNFDKRYNWTEYTLYFLYLKKMNSVELYHCIGDTGQVRQRLFTNHLSVWQSSSFEQWNPELVFSPEDPGLFCIIQSNKNIPPQVVLKKVEKYICKAALPAKDLAKCPTQPE
jgi:hypothetical protein